MPQLIGPSSGAKHPFNTRLVESADINIQPSAYSGNIFHVLRLIRHNRTSSTGEDYIRHIIYCYIIGNIVYQRYCISHIFKILSHLFRLLVLFPRLEPVKSPSPASLFTSSHLLLNKKKTGNPIQVYPRKYPSISPYVGIIQIRLWVKAYQLTLSLLFTQAPRLFSLSFPAALFFRAFSSVKNVPPLPDTVRSSIWRHAVFFHPDFQDKYQTLSSFSSLSQEQPQ